MFCYILVAYVVLVIGDASSTSGQKIQCLDTPDTSDKLVKGNWSDIRFCEENSFVKAVQLNHKPFKDGDTTEFKSLKGIKLYCGDNEQSRVDEPLSFISEDNTEDWRDKESCQNGGYIKGFRARSDGNNGLTGLQLFCEESRDPIAIGGGTGLGNFLGEDIQYCPAGMAIKGIRARLDKETTNRLTDLTDVEIYCVSITYTGTVESLKSDSSNKVILIGSATGAILLIVALIITAVICLKKRKNKGKQPVDDLPLQQSGAGMGNRHDSENSLYGVVGGTTEPQAPNCRSRHDSENSLYGVVA